MEVDKKQIDKAFDHLDDALALTFTESAVRSHIAGDIAAQKQLGMKVSFNLVKSAATEYGKEYKKLLTERGGGYIVENGQFAFKDWFRESSKANREKVADIINASIKEGKGIRETKKDLRGFFNERKRHAEMVARTETAKIQSIATTTRLKEQGIDQWQWITAEDEKVRTSHAERHLKIYNVGEGPELGEPGCRCTKIPYVEEAPDVDLSQPLPEKKVKVPKTVKPAKPIAQESGFMPAKNADEAHTRLMGLTRENTASGRHAFEQGINMKGIPLESQNSVIRAIEDTCGRYNTKLTSIEASGRKSRELASMGYGKSDGSLGLQIQKKLLKNPHFEDAAAQAFEDNRKFNLDTVMGALKRNPSAKDGARLQSKLDLIESTKRWSSATGADDQIFAVVKHEAYHGVYYNHNLETAFKQALKNNKVTAIDQAGVSEYGASSIPELFAEAGTCIDLGLPIPVNVKTAFLETVGGI